LIAVYTSFNVVFNWLSSYILELKTKAVIEFHIGLEIRSVERGTCICPTATLYSLAAIADSFPKIPKKYNGDYGEN